MAQSKTFYFDTNVILRYLLKDNNDHYLRVTKILRQIKNQGGVVVILGEVVAECIYVMEKIYKIPRQVISESLVKFLKSTIVFCEEKEILISTLSDFSVLNLAYVDILLMQVAKKYDGELVSLDKKLLANLK